MQELDINIFIKDSKTLIDYIKDKKTKEVEIFFELYKEKYEVDINNSESKLYSALPFLKSVEEYLFDPLAKEKGFASVQEVESLFEDDILSIK